MCILVGYPKGTKGFKLYNTLTKEFIRSRDVVFDEEKFHEFNDGKQSSKTNSEQLSFNPLTFQNVAEDVNANEDDHQDPTFLNQHSTTNQWEKPMKKHLCETLRI